MQYICLFGIVSLIYGNEDSLLDNFNNNIESFSKIDTKTLSYMPSIQLAVNNKSDISQEQQKSVENILYNEKLLLQWSSRLPSKYSGHYWVLMSKENEKTILADIVKVQPTSMIQFADISMEIVISEDQGKYNLKIRTNLENLERIEYRPYYNSKNNVIYISSYNIGKKYYWLYSLIIK